MCDCNKCHARRSAAQPLEGLGRGTRIDYQWMETGGPGAADATTTFTPLEGVGTDDFYPAIPVESMAYARQADPVTPPPEPVNTATFQEWESMVTRYLDNPHRG